MGIGNRIMLRQGFCRATKHLSYRYTGVMKSTTIEPLANRSARAEQQNIANPVTVIMPFYDRVNYFKQYVSEGLWDGFRIQLVGDGPPKNVLDSLQQMRLQENRVHLNVHSYPRNIGVAYARTTGIRAIKTPYLLFCDDDDFLVEGQSFMKEAVASMALKSPPLFYSMRKVYAFTESLSIKPQYDRKMFDGLTGLELLKFLVQHGEMCALAVGSVFRTEEMKPVGPEAFFKVSEDYVFLARLCGTYPDRRIKIGDKGGYLRLTQHKSLSSKSYYSLEKVVMHLVSMFVGAYYLARLGGVTIPEFQELLRRRGEVLFSSYAKGKDAAYYMADLLSHSKKGKISEESLSSEMIATQNYLQTSREQLPREFRYLVDWM